MTNAFAKVWVVLFMIFNNAVSAQTAAPPPEPKTAEPFAFADFGWLNGNSRQTDFPLATKYFTGEFSLDTNYVYQFNRPKDHTLVGSTNSGRTNEIQVEQVGVGGDFNYENVRGRIMTQFGMYSTMTPRNDASPARGQWHLDEAYRYLSEAYGGYHWDVLNGINLDVGLFMSYIGLCSYYNYDNWVYQMSYVSANTPWFFNGARLQIFPTDRLKLELWLVNGWQSYGMFNDAPGIGGQLLYRPNANWSFVTNEYVGADWLGIPGRQRAHTDTSIQHKYYDQPANFMGKAATSLTVDLGCEWGGDVKCGNQNFVGFMLYNRMWFKHDTFGLTLGTGRISNPGRYLVLVPPVNGATAYTGDGSGAFTQSKGDAFHAWDASITLDYMPKQFITYRLEFIHRQADTPYFGGHGGITPVDGSGNLVNQGPAGSQVAGFTPDLVKTEDRINAALMVRF